jgi:hypothetical protein
MKKLNQYLDTCMYTYMQTCRTGFSQNEEVKPVYECIHVYIYADMLDGDHSELRDQINRHEEELQGTLLYLFIYV